MVKIVFSRITFSEVNCMPSKLHYFVYKEESRICPNHCNRYLEVVKEGCDVLKAVGQWVFAHEAFKTRLPIYRVRMFLAGFPINF